MRAEDNSRWLSAWTVFNLIRLIAEYAVTMGTLIGTDANARKSDSMRNIMVA